jgi:hypothetical protein
MTVGRISVLCWTVFAVMSVGFLPLAAGIYQVHALPPTARIVVAIVVVGLLWWGPFGYAMYLALAVIGKGDRRLLGRGLRGTAEVLSAVPTNMSIQSGGAWNSSRVYRYRLRVSVPGRAPYETVCRMCAAGISQGATVDVAVAPHNHKRVAIDVGQGRGEPRTTERDTVLPTFRALPPEPEDTPPAEFLTPEAERVHLLVELARLHRQGAITDAEFAAEKSRILGR